MLDKLFQIARLVAVVAIIPVLLAAAAFLWSLKQTSDQIRLTATNLPQIVDARIDKTQAAILSKLDTIQSGVSTDLRYLATTADRRLASIEGTADRRLGEIQTSTLSEVSGLRTDLSSNLKTTTTAVANLANVYAAIPATVGDRLDKYTNCDQNDLCWQGQISDTMLAVRTTSRDISKTTISINETLPRMQSDFTKVSDTFATDVPKITSNFAAITDNIKRLTTPKWYDRLLGYGLNGAILYRNLNPVTSLTVTGAQIISGQK